MGSGQQSFVHGHISGIRSSHISDSTEKDQDKFEYRKMIPFSKETLTWLSITK